MPHMLSLRTSGPELNANLWWAAGVFDSRAGIRIRFNSRGNVSHVTMEARVDCDTGRKLQEIIGGSYSGHYWRAKGPDQERIANLLSKHVQSERVQESLRAVLGFRRTLSRGGKPISPAVHEYRLRVANWSATHGRAPGDT